ncbi:MAG TPA: hypothetical protein VFB14_06690 [Bryobacteraceae bacterium]|nr:hypothetical protein [Bryobacteraceae bacterium]
MSLFNRLRYWAALFCAAALVLPPINAGTRKGDKLYRAGQKAEEQKDYVKALDLYDQALATDSRDPSYMIADQRVRGQAADQLISQGRALQKQQKLDEALVDFQRALLADPGSQIALQEIRQTTEMIKEKAQGPPGVPVLTPAEKVQRETEERINSLEGPPTLRPLNNQISSLKMNNQPARVLYESVAKLAGINVLFDPQGIEPIGTGSRNFNLDLNNVTLEDALNYVALVTHTFWKAVSHNAIFVTQETQPKRQEYQDEVVKVFYIQNTTTPQEFTEIFNALRIGSKLSTGIFQVASQNAIVVRGTPDQIAIVEKLVHDLDQPKPEVVVDVIVMEVNKSKTTTLGAALAGQTGGLNIPINFTPRSSITVNTTGSSSTGSSTTSTGSTTATTGSITSTTGTTTGGTSSTTTGSSTAAVGLNSLHRLSSADWSTTLPGALIQALLSDSTSRVLQRPQIRATDGGKASIKFGEKIPYVSGSLNSAVATPGAIPYATTQFQQVDVGVNIDLEPHVNGPNDISMHIKVEVSNTNGNVTIGGIQEPIIVQRVNEANVRMHDGETSVLGGLSDVEGTNTSTGIPGVTNIPALGYLFGSKTRTNTNDQILIALIPHIVRGPNLSVQAEPAVLAGTEQEGRVERRMPVNGNFPAPGTRPGVPPQPIQRQPAPSTYPPITNPQQPNPPSRPVNPPIIRPPGSTP